MRSLGKGKLHQGAQNLRFVHKEKPVAPKCSDCRFCDSNRNFCNKHEFTISDVEDISEMTINCFEAKEETNA